MEQTIKANKTNTVNIENLADEIYFIKTEKRKTIKFIKE
jgi:hypothetical protein